MGPNSKNRIANAFRATKALGIPEEKVKPVLKHLLKLHNKNWDFIEEDNYITLMNAIFEYEEDEAAKREKSCSHVFGLQQDALEEEEVLNEEPERPLKRLRLRQQDGQPSPSNLGGTSQTKRDDEGAELVVPPQSSNGQMDPESHITRNKGKRPISPNASSPQSSKKKVHSHHALIKPKEEPVTEAGKRERATTDKPCSLQIASLTSSADVKVIMNCHTAFEIPNFQMPSLDAVMTMMEGKCRKMYKDLGAEFTVVKVMEDVCHCFLELSAKYATSTATNQDSINGSEAAATNLDSINGSEAAATNLGFINGSTTNQDLINGSEAAATNLDFINGSTTNQYLINGSEAAATNLDTTNQDSINGSEAAATSLDFINGSTTNQDSINGSEAAATNLDFINGSTTNHDLINGAEAAVAITM